MMQGSGQAGTLVKVFIRTRDKKARGVLLPKQISGNQLKKLAADKTNIPLESLSLFNQGQEIHQEAQLQDNNIIHAIDLRNVNVDNIHLYVKLLDQKAAREKYAVNTNMLIKDFISDNLLRLYEVNMDDIFLVYTGKQVDIHKNFKEELIENESEVICVKVKNLQQKSNDQDKIHKKATHEATHALGQKKQEHDDKTIRIATKVAKINADNTTQVLKSGKPDHQQQVEAHQEQTEVVISMKEVEEEQKISETVTHLHEANVETEKQQDGLHEIVIENHVFDVVQHEEIAEPAQSHAVLHSSAPVFEQTGRLQINSEQPNTINFQAEAVRNEEEQPKIVLQFKDAQVEEPVGKSSQVNEAREQPIVETQLAKEENVYISLQEPNLVTQIQEHVEVEETKHQEIVIEQAVTAQHPVQTEMAHSLHYQHEEHQNALQAQVQRGQLESPHVIAEEQIVERLESKPVEEQQALIPSHEKGKQAALPVEVTHQNKEAAHQEVVINNEEEPIEQKIQLQGVQIHNLHDQQLSLTKDQNVPDNANTQNVVPLRNESNQEEQKAEHIQINQNTNQQPLIVNATESGQTSLKEQIQGSNHLIQQEELVVHHHEEPVRVEEKQSQNVTIQHEEVPAEQKDAAPVVETHPTEQIVPVSLQQHNELVDHIQAEPIVQQEIPVHTETQEDHGDSSEIRVALQEQNIQEEPIFQAKIEKCPPIQVVEYHSEGYVAAEPALNAPQIQQPEHKQQERHTDHVHQAQAFAEQVIQAEHRQASELQTNNDNELQAGLTERPDKQTLLPLEAQKTAPVDNVLVLESPVDNKPVDKEEVIQSKQIDNTQPAVELAQEEDSHPSQEKTNHIETIPHQQEAAHLPANLADTQQTPDETKPHSIQYVEEKIVVLEAQADLQEKAVIPQVTGHIDIDHVQHHQVHTEAVGAENPIEESAAVLNSEQNVAEDKDLAETGHQWEVKDQSAPIVLEQFHQQYEETAAHQNEPAAEAKIEQQSHQIELERGVEVPTKKQEYAQEVVRQESDVSLQTEVEPRSVEIVNEQQEHQPVVIETSPVLQTATIQVPQAVANHEEIIQKLQSHPNEQKQQQIPLKTQEPKEAEINHEAETHSEHAEVEQSIHSETEAVTLHQQQRVQEAMNQNEAKEQVAPEFLQQLHEQTHENIAQKPIEAPVELQAVVNQPIPEAKVVVVQEISHEVEPAVTIQETYAEPVKAEPEPATQTEIAPQVHHDQYSQLPYVSSSQLPLSQNSSSSFGNASHNNLEIIAHLKMEAPFQSTQKGVAFQSLKVKSPHSTTNECLIYQEQIIHKSGNQQISIVQPEQAPEGNTYQHAAPIPEARAEPSLIQNINHEEALNAVTANEATD